MIPRDSSTPEHSIIGGEFYSIYHRSFFTLFLFPPPSLSLLFQLLTSENCGIAGYVKKEMKAIPRVSFRHLCPRRSKKEKNKKTQANYRSANTSASRIPLQLTTLKSFAGAHICSLTLKCAAWGIGTLFCLPEM